MTKNNFMDDPPGDMRDCTNAHADAGGSAVNLNVRMIPAEPRDRTAFVISISLSAIALAVSILCAFYSFECGRQAAQLTYWGQRTEAFLEQLSEQGVAVPCDLRPHQKECKK